MKVRYALTLLFIFVGNILLGQAQHFLNGSFEPYPTSTAVACYDNPFYKINTIGSVWMTIVGPQSAIFADSNCGLGYAKQGNYFLGMHYSPTLQKGSQILLQVSPPLLAFNTYYFAFYYKGNFPVTGTGATLYFGYGIAPEDSLHTKMDSMIRVSMRLTTSTSWTKAIVSVSPNINTSYIWAAITNPDTPNDSTTIFLDDFTFNLHEAVNELPVSNSIQLYPNPFNSSTELIIPESVTLPCNAAVYDITGKKVLEQHISNKTSKIECPEFSKGVYVLKLTDKENNVFIKRLFIE